MTRALLGGAAVVATMALASPAGAAGAAESTGKTSTRPSGELYVEQAQFELTTADLEINGESQDAHHSSSIESNSWTWAAEQKK